MPGPYPGPMSVTLTLRGRSVCVCVCVPARPHPWAYPGLKITGPTALGSPCAIFKWKSTGLCSQTFYFKLILFFASFFHKRLLHSKCRLRPLGRAMAWAWILMLRPRSHEISDRVDVLNTDTPAIYLLNKPHVHPG